MTCATVMRAAACRAFSKRMDAAQPRARGGITQAYRYRELHAGSFTLAWLVVALPLDRTHCD